MCALMLLSYDWKERPQVSKIETSAAVPILWDLLLLALFLFSSLLFGRFSPYNLWIRELFVDISFL